MWRLVPGGVSGVVGCPTQMWSFIGFPAELRGLRGVLGSRLVLRVLLGVCVGKRLKGIACVFQHRALFREFGKVAVLCRVAR